MIHELELRLEDAIRSNKTSMPSLKQAPSPRSNQPADDVLTDRIRRLEYKYLVKSAELDAVMRYVRIGHIGLLSPCVQIAVKIC